VEVDIAQAVALRPDVRATPALGPDHRLVEIVLDRLRTAGAAPGMPVVLAPAGSSDSRAQADSAAVAESLARRWGGPVTLGFAAGPVPTVVDAVRSARESTGGPVALASYLLAPGFFQRRLESAGAEVVTGPLAPDDRLVEVVLDRYRAALAG
jgi:sirohydrochlorin ferrochelatase